MKQKNDEKTVTYQKKKYFIVSPFEKGYEEEYQTIRKAILNGAFTEHSGYEYYVYMYPKDLRAYLHLTHFYENLYVKTRGYCRDGFRRGGTYSETKLQDLENGEYIVQYKIGLRASWKELIEEYSYSEVTNKMIAEKVINDEL